MSGKRPTPNAERPISNSIRDELFRAEKHLFQRACRFRDRLRGNRRVICVTGDTFGNDFALRTVTRRATRFGRHENIGRLATLRRMMTNITVERFLGHWIDLMFGVIEICLRHPAID